MTIMTARRTKSNTTKDVATTDDPFEPINLDPPNPAIARWQELADRAIVIPHDGDASKVLEFPRPEWCSEDLDHIGSSPFNTAYRSERVRIAARGCSDARNVEGVMTPAHVNVIAELWESGSKKVYLGIARFEDNRWAEQMVGLYRREALELAEALRAAVDLLGGEA